MNFNNLSGEVVKPSAFDEFTNFITRNKGKISIIIALTLVIVLCVILALCLWKKKKKTSAVTAADAENQTATPVDANVGVNDGAIADLDVKLKDLEGDDLNNYLNNDIQNINDLNKIQSELNTIELLKKDLNDAKNKIAGDLEENLKNRFDAANQKMDQITQALNARKSVIEEANKQAEISAKTITSVHVKFINDNILKGTNRKLIINNNVDVVVKGLAKTNWFNNVEGKKQQIAANIAELKVAGDNKNAYQAFCKMATDNGNGEVGINLSDDEKKAIVAFCNAKMPAAQVTTSGTAASVGVTSGVHK